MSTSVRHIAAVIVAAALLLSLAPAAHAFFPLGAYDSQTILRLYQWRLSDFDTNNDGNVTQGEGLPILYEGGPAGFTTDEMEILDEAFQVWADVEGSYAEFRRGGIITDPTPSPTITDGNPTTVPAFSGLDFMPTIYLQLLEGEVDDTERERADPAGSTLAEIAYPVLGATVIFYALEGEVQAEGVGENYIISSGTIIDADIYLTGAVFRPRTGESGLESDGFSPYGTYAERLKSVMVHEIGHLLGLGHTPLNNLMETTGLTTDGVIETGQLLENAVFWMTGADGIGSYVGATPTMYPIYGVTYYADCGCYLPDSIDLAPDDISGLCWLYPRESLPNFFNIGQEVRTRTRTASGFPSIPIAGSHIVAWADIDNDPTTARVPLFSTMSGLYTRIQSDDDEKKKGEFELNYLWKQFEVPQGDGSWFGADYTLTSCPLNELGLERQAPEGILPTDVDGIEGGIDSFETFFTSEVFHEAENLYDVENKDAGTPLKWNYTLGAVVSADTGRTLSSILPGGLFDIPMFGDPNDVCPLNIVAGDGTTTDTGTTDTGTGGAIQKIRTFRDDFLLKTGLGTAMVSAYYQTAPVLTRYFMQHTTVYHLWKRIVHSFFWFLMHPVLTLLGLATLLVLVPGLLRFNRRRKALAASLLLATLLLFPQPAHALLAKVTTAEMVSGASDIVSATVVSAETSWGDTATGIQTDVVIQVEDTAKGRFNKSTEYTFSVVGGTSSGVVCHVSDMPRFKAGEKVVLYLQQASTGRTTVYGGLYSKVHVSYDKSTGTEYVTGDSVAVQKNLSEDAQEIASQTETDGTDASSGDSGNRIPLATYMDYLRSIARKQRRTE